MSSAIVLPPLKLWAQEQLTALITAKTEADFDQAFDNFIAKHVKIVFNGETQTREQYKKKLQSERAAFGGATISILDTVQAPKLNTRSSQDSGLVGLFYDATYEGGPLIHDAPSIVRSVQSSLNIQVAQDEPIPISTGPFHGDAVHRRVVSLNQVYLDQQGQIKASS